VVDVGQGADCPRVAGDRLPALEARPIVEVDAEQQGQLGALVVVPVDGEAKCRIRCVGPAVRRERRGKVAPEAEAERRGAGLFPAGAAVEPERVRGRLD